MTAQLTDTYRKANRFNMDPCIYGTIAEIGAGQETVRWFFKAGGAAGTVAKAMSAYDMTFSDSIYGDCRRYVSRERLHAMLDTEYSLVTGRLAPARGDECCFFAFANTVATYSYHTKRHGHGWLGIRFQTAPGEAASQVDLHVALHGNSAADDQDALGIIGVNLIYAARFESADPEVFIRSLMDGLNPGQLEVDMVDFSGPAFDEVDNRLMALKLVQQGMTQTAMFQADGKLVQPSDALYKKAVLVERSRFRPPTRLNIALLDRAYEAFCEEPDVERDDVIVLSEITLDNLREGDEIDTGDFLHRVEILCALGKNVMVSNFAEYYKLAQYLFAQTSRPVAIAMGVPTLRLLFEEHYYEDLPGGILEAFGRLFRNDMRLFVCPALDDDGALTKVTDLDVAQHLRHLYRHLQENGYLHDLDSIDRELLAIHADDVIQMIRSGDTAWEDKVPETVVETIRQRGLFGQSA